LENFRKIANWALKHQREDGSWDSFSPIESKRYTVSSMCQGEGASLLLRASIVFHDERYKNAALNAVDFMLLPIQQGGTAIYENSNLYLEEYPQIPRCSVMNGWIFSLFGLYDAMVTAPEKYLDAFIRSYDTLCISIDQYDAGFWSYYDLNKHLASPAYHDLHIALLTVLNDLKNSSKFDKTIKKFNGYSRRPLYRIKAIIVKIIQKLTDETDAIIIN
jgi:hypothetical protein